MNTLHTMRVTAFRSSDAESAGEELAGFWLLTTQEVQFNEAQGVLALPFGQSREQSRGTPVLVGWPTPEECDYAHYGLVLVTDVISAEVRANPGTDDAGKLTTESIKYSRSILTIVTSGQPRIEMKVGGRSLIVVAKPTPEPLERSAKYEEQFKKSARGGLLGWFFGK